MQPEKLLLFAFIFFIIAGIDDRPSSAKDFGVFQTADSNSYLLPENEREHLRARDLRERSEEKSGAYLGYPNVFQNYPNRTIDYYLLSHQINQLRMLIEDLESRKRDNLGKNENFIPKLPPGLDIPSSLGMGYGLEESGGVISVYGEKGPNTQSVRLLLEYNLLVSGNPRLKIGTIEENEEFVIAEIVTLDGSLVEKYSVDRKTGLWKVIRK